MEAEHVYIVVWTDYPENNYENKVVGVYTSEFLAEHFVQLECKDFKEGYRAKHFSIYKMQLNYALWPSWDTAEPVA